MKFGQQIKHVYAKTVLNTDFSIEKLKEREVTIFPKNFKSILFKGKRIISGKYSWSKVLGKPLDWIKVFFEIGLEIRKLKWFEYIQNGCHGCRHI